MDDHRFSVLCTGIAEVLLRLKATEAEKQALFSQPRQMETSVKIASGLLSAVHDSSEKVAITIISEAREIFGDEAANQLLAKLRLVGGEDS